jgi:hypothetical protein
MILFPGFKPLTKSIWDRMDSESVYLLQRSTIDVALYSSSPVSFDSFISLRFLRAVWIPDVYIGYIDRAFPRDVNTHIIHALLDQAEPGFTLRGSKVWEEMMLYKHLVSLSTTGLDRVTFEQMALIKAITE